MVEDIEKEMVKILCWDSKVPGTCARTKAAGAPAPVPAAVVSSGHRIFGGEPDQQMPPLPKQGGHWAPRERWILEVTWGE